MLVDLYRVHPLRHFADVVLLRLHETEPGPELRQIAIDGLMIFGKHRRIVGVQLLLLLVLVGNVFGFVRNERIVAVGQRRHFRRVPLLDGL